MRFTLEERDLSHVDEGGIRKVAAGRYRLFVGGGQPDATSAAVSAELEIRGERALPR